VVFGSGLGLLYSLTTLSGAPLAFVLKNEGLAKKEFKAAISLIRVPLGLATALAYWGFGLVTAESAGLIPWIVPGLMLGLTLGARVAERLDMERFRRVCVSFDIWIIGFGLARVLRGMGALPGFWAPAFVAAIVVGDVALYLRQRDARLARSAAVQ
jgi:uncharacterized membrane protein YfcA